MLNRFKKNDKKGFTLVELIVVLVILAILAALLIPALTGYIDKAKGRQIIAETRQAVMAAQTLADEIYLKTGTVPTFAAAGSGFEASDILQLADLKSTAVVSNVTFDTNPANKTKIATLTYAESADTGAKSCVYTAANADQYVPST